MEVEPPRSVMTRGEEEVRRAYGFTPDEELRTSEVKILRVVERLEARIKDLEDARGYGRRNP